MSTIDIGAGAINRPTNIGYRYTCIQTDNPANDSGTLDEFQVWAYTALSGFKIGTFSEGESGYFTCRDYETIGSVSSGSLQTFTGKQCAVQSGDMIGAYWYDGKMEYASSGGSGYLYMQSGDQFGAGEVFYPYSVPTALISIYGAGETVFYLTVYDGGHSLTSDNASIVIAQTLNAADAAHANAADNIGLVEAHAISVGNADHAMTVEGVQFTNVLCVLPTSDSSHAMTVDSVDVTENYTLSPAAAAHAHTADGNLSINQYMAVMSHDSGHALTSANVSLTQAHDLVVADATHALTNGAVGFLQFHTLTAADTAHAMTVESVDLTENYTLSTADAAHLHTADGDLALSQVNIVYPDDSEHALISDDITLFQFIYGAHVRVARSYRG